MKEPLQDTHPAGTTGNNFLVCVEKGIKWMPNNTRSEVMDETKHTLTSHDYDSVEL